MSSPSRTAQFTKIHKVLKKAYKPVVPDGNRSVLEHLLFACCLENASYDVAEESFAALAHNFFDWNEVRVSTVRELSEVAARLPEPAAAANRVKHVLQSVFEGSYSFDLEDLRKQNLGPATEKLAKLKGTTPFTVAYVVQAALGGHAIPVDAGTLGALRVLDLVSEGEIRSSTVAGLERAIPKPKGFEFGSLVHQLGASFTANPYAPSLHEILLEINPDVRDRLPKRRRPAEETPRAEAKPAEKTAKAAAGEAEPPVKGKRAPGKKKPEAGKAKASEKAAEPKAAERKKTEPPAAERKKAVVEDKASAAKKKASAKKEPPVKKKDVAEKEKTAAESGKKEAGKEHGSGGLAKRKPR